MTSYRRAVTMATYRWTGLPLLLLMLLTSTGVHVGGRSTDEDDNQSEDASNPNNMSDEKRLIKKLLGDYEKVGLVGRPVFNQSETIKVKYGLSLIQILDLDEKNQVLTTNCWSRYEWVDGILSWDPAEFGEVNEIRVPVSKIWKPDIVLYNYADERLKEHRDAMAVVKYDGNVIWMPTAIFKSTCSIDIMYFPFDIQTCKLKFGSWTYNGYKLDICFESDQSSGQVDMSSYIPSNEWEVVASPARKNVIIYPCCPEPYPDLTFNITIKRIPIFHTTVLIIPCILLSVLTLVSFWLPPETPAKVLLGMNIFLAFFLLLKLLAANTPSSEHIPLIGAFFCINMILITLSSFISVMVINVYMRADKKNKVPRWLKKFVVDGLSRVLCMEQRKNVMESRKRNRPPREHVTHHVTHVIDDGAAAADGIRKSHTHAKTIKSPVLPYNKWDTTSTVVAVTASHLGVNVDGNGSGGGLPPHSPLTSHLPQFITAAGIDSGVLRGTISTNDQQVAQSGIVEAEVREMKRMLKSFMMKLQSRDAKERIALEWRLVALALDRMFFYMYLVTIGVSIITISVICYSRYTELEQAAELLRGDGEPV